MGALRAGHYLSRTGLFFVQPYDPNRIPLICVHGLISTPQMWLRVANQLNADPEVRARYQFWAFSYPTGNPLVIFSLSPKNPTLLVMDKVPIRVPYHSIIGDRGKGDSPNSTDGVVPYWSSHLDGAQSELIVPGPHGSCELPQTIEELRRILHLNLKTTNP